MVRILYVHHGKGIGGAPLSLLFLIRGLDRSLYQPTVLCLHESEAADLFRKEGIETIVLESIKDFSHTNVLWYTWWQFPKTIYRACHIPLSYRRARKYLKKRSFDIVHLNTSTLGAFGLAAKHEGCKVVWHIREPIAHGYFGLRRRWVRSVIDHTADAILPICRYDASQLVQSDRIRVVYNFVNFEQFDASLHAPEVRKQLDVDNDAQIVLMLGGSNPIKGTEHFVRAAVKIAGQFSKAVFLIAGETPSGGIRNLLSGRTGYHWKVQDLIPQQLQSRIRFIGVRSDIPALLSESTMLCFPSTVPHFARPLIEASAMAKPVIASDLGGPQELVKHGETGLLVPPANAEALADAIADILASPEKALAFGASGKKFAKENFNATTNTRMVVETYEQLQR